jgi:hypothetical protein
LNELSPANSGTDVDDDDGDPIDDWLKAIKRRLNKLLGYRDYNLPHKSSFIKGVQRMV